MSRPSEQAITHIREWCGDSSQYTPCRGKSDNTAHIWYRRPSAWQQFTTTINELVQAHLTLVHVFHALPLWANRGWLVHYSDLHHYRYGRIASDSVTISATKITGAHKSCMRQYIINTCSSGPTRYSLSLSCLAGSQINQLSSLNQQGNKEP
jgi:hypothetical protein